MDWRDYTIIIILILLTIELGLFYYLIKYNSNFLKQIQSIRGIQIETLNAGDKAPFFREYDQTNKRVIAKTLFSNQNKTLILFINTNCPICKKILSQLDEVSSRYDLNYLIINSDALNDDTEIKSMIDGNISYIRSPHISMLYNIRNVPHAVLVNEAGIVQISSYIENNYALLNILVNEKRNQDVS